MHDVGMRFFALVEEHNRVRPAPHRFGKLSALLVTDITGRRTDQARSREFFHVLRHVDLNKRVAVAEHELGKLWGKKRFADAGRAEKNERADRPPRILEIGAAAAEGFGYRGDGLILADDLALEFLLHLEEFLGLLLLHPLEQKETEKLLK